MLSEELFDLTDTLPPDMPVMVEIDGVVHNIHRVRDDFEGLYLIVDTDEEERELR